MEKSVFQCFEVLGRMNTVTHLCGNIQDGANEQKKDAEARKEVECPPDITPQAMALAHEMLAKFRNELDEKRERAEDAEELEAKVAEQRMDDSSWDTRRDFTTMRLILRPKATLKRDNDKAMRGPNYMMAWDREEDEVLNVKIISKEKALLEIIASHAGKPGVDEMFGLIREFGRRLDELYHDNFVFPAMKSAKRTREQEKSGGRSIKSVEEDEEILRLPVDPEKEIDIATQPAEQVEAAEREVADEKDREKKKRKKEPKQAKERKEAEKNDLEEPEAIDDTGAPAKAMPCKDKPREEDWTSRVPSWESQGQGWWAKDSQRQGWWAKDSSQRQGWWGSSSSSYWPDRQDNVDWEMDESSDESPFAEISFCIFTMRWIVLDIFSARNRAQWRPLAEEVRAAQRFEVNRALTMVPAFMVASIAHWQDEIRACYPFGTSLKDCMDAEVTRLVRTLPPAQRHQVEQRLIDEGFNHAAAEFEAIVDQARQAGLDAIVRSRAAFEGFEDRSAEVCPGAGGCGKLRVFRTAESCKWAAGGSGRLRACRATPARAAPAAIPTPPPTTTPAPSDAEAAWDCSLRPQDDGGDLARIVVGCEPLMGQVLAFLAASPQEISLACAPPAQPSRLRWPSTKLPYGGGFSSSDGRSSPSAWMPRARITGGCSTDGRWPGSRSASWRCSSVSGSPGSRWRPCPRGCATRPGSGSTWRDTRVPPSPPWSSS
ncbi:unnamed protein product [Prorocentrum cordatum]|uniref:Uncharacterized protein n=1 Tax=Prorocentrum cordatum TaxID=2364126 RepID=A0ABN9RFJ3_9DINO|nr:unnamed protein product [Polarella glacialis]